MLTQTFSANWPDAPHRVLRSSVAAAEAFQSEVVGETPQVDGTMVAVRRFDCLVVNRGTTGLIEAMPLWAGESVDAVGSVGNVELAKWLQAILQQVGQRRESDA